MNKQRRFFIACVALFFLAIASIVVLGISQYVKANNDSISGGTVNVYNTPSDNGFNGGAVDYQRGICTGNEEPSQLCNVNAYNFTAENSLTAESISADTNLLAANGYVKSTVINTASTTYATVGNVLYANCTGSDINGCDDGVYNVIRFMADSQGGSRFDSEATTTFEIRSYMDDSASSSMEISYEYWGRLDNTSVLTKIAEFDSGTFNVVGSSTLSSVRGKFFSNDGTAGYTGTITSSTIDNLIIKNGLVTSNTST